MLNKQRKNKISLIMLFYLLLCPNNVDDMVMLTIASFSKLFIQKVNCSMTWLVKGTDNICQLNKVKMIGKLYHVQTLRAKQTKQCNLEIRIRSTTLCNLLFKWLGDMIFLGIFNCPRDNLIFQKVIIIKNGHDFSIKFFLKIPS
ncbi:hypothetical protein BpHYR1_022997 [Brachionus plicatilis]|uniref:Uncharacterized protein n=1 Tax=Brachionus plicatilis TaxID=10195 RepID=A0A3M7QWJ2_BRAPC|nr:hypothetical protein BpHYR1_022997 [Brachionus plicatilis]